jgi:hypothetical protein
MESLFSITGLFIIVRKEGLAPIVLLTYRLGISIIILLTYRLGISIINSLIDIVDDINENCVLHYLDREEKIQERKDQIAILQREKRSRFVI